MKNLSKNIIKFSIKSIVKVLGKRNTKMLIEYMILVSSSWYTETELLFLAYRKMGILKHKDFIESGENFVLEYILKKYSTGKDKLVLFDVGANVGDYANNVRKYFPKDVIFAFEPNPVTYQILINAVSNSNINCRNLGFGSKEETTKIYSYNGDKSTQLASLYQDVFSDLYKDELNIQKEDITEFCCNIKTIDSFCEIENIDFIDFLKIDVEGHELDVLKGAKQMIEGEKINIIQFEFNETNILSRVFLRDFYKMLVNYYFFRIDTNRFIPLNEYSSTNEIFKYQNILALNKNMIIRES